MRPDDKEAFEKWWSITPETNLCTDDNKIQFKAVWQAALEYKTSRFDAYVRRDEMIKELEEKLAEAWKSRDELADRLIVSKKKLSIAIEALEYIEQNLESPKKIEIKIEEALKEFRGEK
jgi:hypothetical protein